MNMRNITSLFTDAHAQAMIAKYLGETNWPSSDRPAHAGLCAGFLHGESWNPRVLVVWIPEVLDCWSPGKQSLTLCAYYVFVCVFLYHLFQSKPYFSLIFIAKTK